MTRRTFRVVLPLLLALSLTGCAPEEPASGNPATSDTARARSEAAAADTPLAASLQIEQGPDSLLMLLQVTNSSSEPVELTFPTGQAYDFAVERDGEELWRWSADQMFTQAIRAERLGSGETRTYEATWSPPAGLAGRVTVRGWLTASDERVEQRAEVVLP